MPATRSAGLSRFASLAVASAVVVALLIGVTLLMQGPDVGPSPAPGPTADGTPQPPILSDYTLAAPGRYTVRGAGWGGITRSGWPPNVSAVLPTGWMQYGPARGGGIRRYAAEMTSSGEVSDTNAHLAELTMWSVGDVARDGCSENPLDEELVDIGPSVEELAAALADIPGVSVSQPVAASLDGFEGLRMQLTVPAQADCTLFLLWLSSGDHRGEVWGHASQLGWIHHIWIMDIDGRRFVIDVAAAPDAPTGLGSELQRILDSIEIQPKGQGH